MIKRIICILMMLILVSQGCFAQDVFIGNAKTEEYIPLSGASFEVGGIVELEDEEPISFFNANPLPFDEYIAEFVLNSDELPEKITGLAQYGIHKDEYKGEFFKKYIDAVMKHPETLLRTALNGCYYNSDGIITAVIPVYLVADKAEADSARLQMETAVNEYINLANECYDGTSTQKYVNKLQKLLVIHDKMVANCDYDVRVLSEDPDVVASVDKTVYHAFGALCNKVAVCQGYSQALYMIAKKIGIEMDFCHSEEKNHVWNYVKLNGKWYHMDMTNDDPIIKDENGNLAAREDTRAWHRYFLVSDDGLVEGAHGTDYGHRTGKEINCNDAQYEAGYLFNINTIFTAEKGENGYFTVTLRNVPAPWDANEKIQFSFRSKTLHTGSVVTYPFTHELVMENDEKVKYLYLAQYATKDIPPARTFVKTANGIKVFPIQENLKKDRIGWIEVAKDVGTNPFGNFSSFIFDAKTLQPYAPEKRWSAQ